MKGTHDINNEFLAVYDQLADPLFRHCLYKISNREKALDLVQDTFTRAWQYLSEGKKVTHLKSFIYKIANNLIIDEYRKRKSESLDSLVEEGFDPAEAESHTRMVLSAEARIAVEGIKHLPEPYRKIMELRFISGHAINEIADLVGESENNVSVRLTRGTQKLKEILHAHEH